MQAAQTSSFLGVPPTLTRMLWMLGFQRRGVRLWECEMLLPKLGFLPQMSQVAATGELQRKGCAAPDVGQADHRMSDQTTRAGWGRSNSAILAEGSLAPP